jgi:ADP-ribose pyrophosphatase YjhB (NUDIX family)
MTEIENKKSKIPDCDNKSVGMIIWRDDNLLLEERMKIPFGFAIPSGHVDDHGSFEDAAKEETLEEVGLKVTDLKLIFEGRRENKCRRPGGSWHYWKLYETKAEGEIVRSLDETKQAGWYTKDEVQKLAKKTDKYNRGLISEEEWQKNPGLEPDICAWLRKLSII